MTVDIEPRLSSIPSNWQGAVIVCRKCSRKLGGGFGPKGKQSLAKALRKAKHTKKGRKVSFGVVEVGCLGVCPRGAVTLIDAARPGRWLLVPAGADVAALAESFGQASDTAAPLALTLSLSKGAGARLGAWASTSSA